MRFGIIGGGLMGKELASALGRWFALSGVPHAEVVAVCDLAGPAREWFGRVPTVRLLTDDHRELLADEGVDAVYVAVPHNLHERIYTDVVESGKDLLAEKPFGMDMGAAERIFALTAQRSTFTRVSSE